MNQEATARQIPYGEIDAASAAMFEALEEFRAQVDAARSCKAIDAADNHFAMRLAEIYGRCHCQQVLSIARHIVETMGDAEGVLWRKFCQSSNAGDELRELVRAGYPAHNVRVREALTAQFVTLDGQPAVIAAAGRQFAKVAMLPSGPAYDFAWSTALRVVLESGGKFKS